MREADRRGSIPIHVLIQSHIQPSDLVYLPADHIADCYCADAGGGGIRAFDEAFEGRSSGNDSGVWQRLLRLSGEAESKTIRINL
jgi:hypothetical protein